jgi:hypothetical protein
VQKEYLTESVQAEISERVQTDHAVHSVKAQTVREEVSAKAVRSAATDHVVHSAKVLTGQEEVSVRDPTDHVEHSVKVQTVHVASSVKVQTVREEVSATESQADSETQERRVSQRETSTISAMRTKAESTK